LDSLSGIIIKDDAGEDHTAKIKWNKDNRDPKIIETLLQEWGKKTNLKLTHILQEAHLGTGFPIWRFGIKTQRKNYGTDVPNSKNIKNPQ